MKKSVLLLFALVATMVAMPVEAKKDKTTPEQKGLMAINRGNAEAYVGFLASDALKGRESGTEHGHIAGEYLIAVLKQMGAKPLFGNSYVQHFDAYSKERKRNEFTVVPEEVEKIKKGPHRKAPMRNILAKIDGKNPEEIVIVGAHYDHLGYDPMLVGDKIFNGADDNASGVQAVLQILSAFAATGQQPERTVIFALWDGEERGFLGSTYFVDNFADIRKVKSYMNFDMIGRDCKENGGRHVNLMYVPQDSIYGKWLTDDIEKHSLELEFDSKTGENLNNGSDQVPFFKAGVSILWYQTGGHPDFHKPTDEPHLLNWDKMVEITKSAFLCMWKMANNDF